MNKRAYHLLRKFGITEEQYDDLHRKQEGRCGVCGRTSESFNKKLAVDHDHKTGEIRGLLCIHCNRYVVGRHHRGSGFEVLLKAYEYLSKQYTGWMVPSKKKKRRRRCRVKRKKG